jgi:TolB protein
MLRGVFGCSLLLVPLCLLFCVVGVAARSVINREQIAYSGSFGTIHLTDVTVNLQVELVSGLSDIPTSFNWSPDGRYMLFAMLNGGAYSFYLVDVLTRQTDVVLTKTPGTLPVWSPDSQSFAYASVSDICIYQHLTKVSRCLSQGEVDALVWSPLGNEIAFISDDVLYVMNTVDGASRQVTPVGSLSRSLAWSPDGRSLVYTAEDTVMDVRDLFLVELATGEVRNITNNINGYTFSAVWSPRSTRLAYISQRLGNFDVYIYDFIREDARNLTDHPAYEGVVDWASNGQYLAYISDRNGLPAVYIQREGALPRFINIAVSYNAAWRPAG